MKNVAVSTSADLISDASPELERENNYEYFKVSTPGNLKFLESLLSAEPENEDLLLTAVKGFSGYAFLVWETELLAKKYAKKSYELEKAQALKYYSRALQYAQRLMAGRDLPFHFLLKNSRNKEKFFKILSERLSDEDKEFALFTAQAWGGYINLNRDNLRLIAQLSTVKNLFDWVCEQDQNLYFGACNLFYGAYESGRPKAFGGNPSKGKRYFEEGIKKYPLNLFHRVSYLQYYVIPMYDQKLFKQEMNELEKLVNDFEQSYYWSLKNKQETRFGPDYNTRQNLFNATALQRYKIFKQYSQQIF